MFNIRKEIWWQFLRKFLISFNLNIWPKKQFSGKFLLLFLDFDATFLWFVARNTWTSHFYK